MKAKRQAWLLGTLVLAALAGQVHAAKNESTKTQSAKQVRPGAAPETNQPAGQNSTQPQQLSNQQKLHPVANAVLNRGARDCAQRVNQISGFLTNGKEFAGSLFVSPDNPNQHILSVSLELQAPNNMQYAGMTFAPGQAPGRCSATYETVTYWNDSCRDVAIKLYPNYAPSRPLQQNIAMLDGGPSVRVFLMSAGQGCVAIKKELAF